MSLQELMSARAQISNIRVFNMKKNTLRTLFIAFLFASLPSLFAEVSAVQKKFIKGNVQDKTAAVKESTADDAYMLAEKGIDFVLEARPLIGADRDLSALAVASVLKLPRDESVLAGNFPEINSQLVQIFNLFEDETVRIAVLDKLETTSAIKDFSKAVELVNSYLKLPNDRSTSSAVTGKAIATIGRIGDSDSFKIIYSAWRDGIYPLFNNQIEASLLLLSVSHISDTIRVISVSNPEDIGDFFELIKESSEVSQEFKAEIAENALSVIIHNAEDNPENLKGSAKLQLSALQAIADANWTRAAGLSVRYFSVAASEYEKGALNEEQFIQVIRDITALSSPDCAQSLSDYLAEMNSKTEKNQNSAQNVVLAIINSLGELGDKTAFDNLLYVTYLNYPETIKSAARDSLAKLKWQ